MRITNNKKVKYSNNCSIKDRKKNVYVDEKIQRFLLNRFLSIPYEKKDHNISTIIRPYHQKV